MAGFKNRKEISFTSHNLNLGRGFIKSTYPTTPFKNKNSSFFSESYCNLLEGYYINLEKRVDKKIKMEERLASLNANVMRFQAVTPEDLTNEEKGMSKMRPSQIATSRSHYQVLKLAQERDLPYVLILEDDVVFCKDINKKLYSFINSVPGNWDMLYLNFNERSIIKQGAYAKMIKGTGAYSYIVPKKMYSILLKLLENFTRRTDTVDDLYSDYIFPNYNCYVSMPTLCYVEEGWSDNNQCTEPLEHLKKYFKDISRESIPKIIHQIWLGDQERRPQNMMDTWIKLYPDYEYKLWTEENLPEIICKEQYEEFLNFTYPGKPYLKYCGLSDILRYELLMKFGGIFIDADAVAINKIPDSFLNCESWIVYENEKSRPGLLANGYMASIPGGEFISKVVEEVSKINSPTKREPWQSVGTQFISNIYYKHFPFETKVFPSHYFIPKHFSGEVYKGSDIIYAEQYWGSSKNNYEELKILIV